MGKASEQIKELEDEIMRQLREKGRLEMETEDAMKIMHFLDWARHTINWLDEAAGK